MTAAIDHENREAVVRVLRMLLSTSVELKGSSDDDAASLSRLIDKTRKELYGRQKDQSAYLLNPCHSGVTNNLLVVLRDCLLTHRWRAALRVLISIAHQLMQYRGRMMLHCTLELCAQLSLPIPDSLIQRFKTYAELTEYQVAVECFMARAAAGHPLSTCRMALTPLLKRRFVAGRDETRDRLLVRAYGGLASYVEYVGVRRIAQSASRERRDEATQLMKTAARDALDKWDSLVDTPGVWDVFIVKQVELLEAAGDLDAAEDVLLKYTGRRPRRHPQTKLTEASDQAVVWPNALQLLFSFYERHPRPNNEETQLGVLRELCTAVPSHPLVLELCRRLDDERSDIERIRLLFDLLDYASWRDDRRVWRFFVRELSRRASTDGNWQTSVESDPVRECWSIREDWWPAYHFAVRSLPTDPSTLSEDSLTLIGYKASAAYLLCGVGNSYTETAMALADRVAFKTKSISQLRKLVKKQSTLFAGT